MSLNESSPAGTAPDTVEEIHEEVEIEVYGKKNVRPPKARKYVIRIDKVKYKVEVPSMTGRQLLVLAGKAPKEPQAILADVKAAAEKAVAAGKQGMDLGVAAQQRVAGLVAKRVQANIDEFKSLAA